MNKLFAVAFSISAYTAVDAFASGNLLALGGAAILCILAFRQIKEPQPC